MIFEELSIKGVVLVKPQILEDARGFFLERYRFDQFKHHGIDAHFVQDNHSRSRKHVLRGLHFQLPPFSQAKLVWVTRGAVFDVAVDLRRDSPTFGQWCGEVLSEENGHALFIPTGFAHGFVALSETVDLLYKMTNYYAKEYDRGVIWNDPDIGIAWPVQNPILSEKDGGLPTLRNLEFAF